MWAQPTAWLLQVVRVTIPPPKDGKPRDYAFVEFQDAQIAASIVDSCEKGQKPSLDGYSLEVCSSQKSWMLWTSEPCIAVQRGLLNMLWRSKVATASPDQAPNLSLACSSLTFGVSELCCSSSAGSIA